MLDVHESSCHTRKHLPCHVVQHTSLIEVIIIIFCEHRDFESTGLVQKVRKSNRTEAWVLALGDEEKPSGKWGHVYPKHSDRERHGSSGKGETFLFTGVVSGETEDEAERWGGLD